MKTPSPSVPQVPEMSADELLLSLVDELSGIRIALVSCAQLLTLSEEERRVLSVNEDGDLVPRTPAPGFRSYTRKGIEMLPGMTNVETRNRHYPVRGRQSWGVTRWQGAFGTPGA